MRFRAESITGVPNASAPTARCGLRLTRGPTLASFSFPGGAVAQLGERLNGIQEVDGSIPFGSTNLHRGAAENPPVCLPTLGIDDG